MKSVRGRTIPCALLVAGVVMGFGVLDWSAHPGEQIGIAKERTLRQDLFTLRQVISQYTLDKRRAPESLDDLVKAGYIKFIPIDPFTGRADWVVDKEQELRDTPLPDTVPGVVDVHSASNTRSTDGTAYSTW